MLGGGESLPSAALIGLMSSGSTGAQMNAADAQRLSGTFAM